MLFQLRLYLPFIDIRIFYHPIGWWGESTLDPQNCYKRSSQLCGREIKKNVRIRIYRGHFAWPTVVQIARIFFGIISINPVRWFRFFNSIIRIIRVYFYTGHNSAGWRVAFCNRLDFRNCIPFFFFSSLPSAPPRWDAIRCPPGFALALDAPPRARRRASFLPPWLFPGWTSLPFRKGIGNTEVGIVGTQIGPAGHERTRP